MGRYQGKRAAPPQGRRDRLAPARAFLRRHRRGVLAVSVVAGLLAAAAAAGTIWWVTNVKAPEIPVIDPGGRKEGQPLTPGGAPEGEEAGLGSLVEGIDVQEELPDYISDQWEGVYTFLLIGRTTMDDNSDMIMLVVFDSNTGAVDACSIPRDTMINISADTKKINAAIWSGVNNLKSWVRKTIGIYPNFYVMVDWEGIGEMVEAIGGVYFDVPCRMYYTDPTAGFTIDLEPGYQLLDGDKAMQLIRWRKNAPGYAQYAAAAGFDGSDTKRTQMQQSFIAAAAKQILQLKNLPYLGSMLQVFKENVETDLSVGNLAWFAQTALNKGSADQVEFHTLPANYSVTALSLYSTYKNQEPVYLSYVTMYGSQLVRLVNEKLNPYAGEISLGDLDLMRVNSDGTISSSTGTLADTRFNTVIAHLDDIKNGLAHLDSSYTVVYDETEDPEDPDAEDSENPDAEDPGSTGQGNPDGKAPERPAGEGSGDASPDTPAGAGPDSPDMRPNIPAQPENHSPGPENL